MIFLEKIKNFPISFYSIVMGLLGFVIALQKTIEIFRINSRIPLAFLTLATIIFIAITSLFLCKIFLYKNEILNDFSHPVKISFFPTFSISLLLFSIAFLQLQATVSHIFWIMGSISHIAFTFLVISQWIKGTQYKIEHLSPAWFIPVVGNLLIPVSGVSFINNELLWFFFSIGIIFWLMLITIIMYRVFFHELLVAKLMPTLFILIAPPSIGVISYFKLTQSIDNFSRVLYYFAFFIALLLIMNMRMFIIKKFYLSQWAFTFPLTAFSIASALMFHQIKIEAFLYLHLIFVGLSAGIIAFLLYKTYKAILLHEICRED